MHSVTIRWYAGECPEMPESIAFVSTIQLSNSKNFIERRCVIGKVTIKKGVVPKFYKQQQEIHMGIARHVMQKYRQILVQLKD